jgi:hypothetical protein
MRWGGGGHRRCRAARATLGVALSLALAACSTVTDPEIEEFEFIGLEPSQPIEESVDARAFTGEIVFVGQIRTPHACFAMQPSIERSGGSVTLRIDAQSRNDLCVTLPGAYRYTGVIRSVAAGSYDFLVVHAVPGQPHRTYTFSLVVR